jgi:membrane protein implicated in regulation of membrane protease activity
VEPAFIWIIVAVILGVAELFVGTLVLAMVAGGAALAALAAALGLPLWVQAVVLAVGSGVSILALRPFLKQALEARQTSGALGMKAFEGTEVLVLETIDTDGGVVEIGGDRWTAHSLEPDQVLEPGEHVTVVEIKGATVVVWRQH